MVKKKNNDKEYYLTDIRQPHKSDLKKKKADDPDVSVKASVLGLGDNFLFKTAKKNNNKKKFSFNKKTFLIFTALFLILTAVLFFQVQNFFSLIGGTFSDFNQEALRPTDNLSQELKVEDINEGDNNSIQQGFSEVLRLLVSAPSLFASTRKFVEETRSLSEIFLEIRLKGINWIFEDGKALIDKLENAKEKTQNINNFLTKIKGLGMLPVDQGLSLGQELPLDNINYLEIQHRLVLAEDFLEGLIAILQPEDNPLKQSHLILLFKNASEIRPAGGFVGSYAHLIISDGEIKNIEVYDIAYPDRLWDSRVIPPLPLQLITTSWEARDANWFFDFRTSARKIKLFLESSPLYSGQSAQQTKPREGYPIIFDGVIAINHRVLGDIFQIIDKVELPNYKIVLNKNNYLYEIQREVSSDSFIRGSERKNILKELTPKLIDKIKNFDGNQKNQLFNFLSQRIKNKDIKFYFSDTKIQKFIEEVGAAGDVYELPDNFFGDYLAVVNANIGGGKTDVFMKQKIVLKSKLDESGRIYNNLQIERHHTGDSQKADFYRAVNQNFIRILTPKNSVVSSVSGNTVKNIRPKLNYSRLNYKKDPDVELFEKGEESGKQIFGYWFNVSPGKKGNLELSYQRTSLISEGVFRFIYEKQSGVDSALHYHLTAPKGYIFVETQSSEFIYINENPPSRLIIDLNLKKID